MPFNPLLKPEQDEAVKKWLALQMGQSRPGSPTAGVNGVTKGPPLPPRPPMKVAGMADGGEVDPDKWWQTASRNVSGKFPEVSGEEPQFNTPDASDDGDEWMKLSKNIRSEGPGPNDPGQTPDSNDADNEKVVTSHPGTQPDELAPYLKSQEVQVDKFGPDQEAQVMQHLQEGYKKPGFIASEGLAGLGDAIMQGVARAGPGQALGTIERNKENQMTQVPAEMQKLREGNLQGMKEKMALQQMNPKSALSQAAAPVLEATLTAMGIPKDQLQKFLSNPAEARRAIDVLKEVIPAKDKVKIENELKLMELKFQEQNATANRAVAEEGRQNEATKTKQDALKELANMKWYNRVLHPGISGALKQQAGLEKPELPDYSEHLPSGSTYKAPDGTTRRKK